MKTIWRHLAENFQRQPPVFCSDYVGPIKPYKAVKTEATHVACLAARATQASAWPAGHAFCGPRKNSTQAAIFKGDPNFLANPLAQSRATNSWKRNSKIARQSRDIRVKPYIKNPFISS